MSRLLRVLAVSPHFPPVNAADHHRLRTALPYVRDLGIEMHVLAVDPRDVEGQPIDPFLEETLPTDVPVTRVRAIPAGITRCVGVGNVALRSLLQLHRAATRLIRTQKFDLAFFTSTQFACFGLAPVWRRLYGLRYVLDFQDPWINPHYRRSGTRPPGGWKFGLVSALNRLVQRPTIRHASGIIRVSEAYRFRGRRCPVSTIPFGVAESDVERVRAELVPRNDGLVRWVAVGRGGQDLWPSLEPFFSALKAARDAFPERFANLRVEFHGTSYAPRGRGVATIRPLADRHGVGDLVEEFTDRIGYREALERQLSADALLLPTSSDAAYVPSKLAGLLMARRPLLTLAAADSPIAGRVRELGADLVLSREMSAPVSMEVLTRLLNGETSAVSDEALQGMSARASTERLASFLHLVAEATE